MGVSRFVTTQPLNANMSGNLLFVGLLALIQLSWATALSGLRQGGAGSALAASAAAVLEEDEMFVDLALEGRVFHNLPPLLLTSQCVREQEFYLRRLHALLTDFLALMPLKVKELRNRADDAARNACMHEQEGIQYTVPLAGQHFPQLLGSLAELYKGDPLDLNLSGLYWAPTETDQGRHSTPAKQIALYKFVRLAGDLLMPSLFVPYVTMLTGLADSPASAPHCFKLLKLNSSSSSNVCLDHFFQSLGQYHANLQQQGRQGGGESTIYRSQPLTRGISPQEVAGLTAVLELSTVLAERCEAARVAMAEHPAWSVVPTILGLIQCSVPTTIKARLVGLLSALAASPDLVHPLWSAIEGASLMAGNNRPGLIAELEEVEARQEEFPLTRASLTLLDKLTDTEIPGSLGAGARAPGFQPYLSYIQVTWDISTQIILLVTGQCFSSLLNKNIQTTQRALDRCRTQSEVAPQAGLRVSTESGRLPRRRGRTWTQSWFPHSLPPAPNFPAA